MDWYTFLQYTLDVMDNLCSLNIRDDSLVVCPYNQRYMNTKDIHLPGDIRYMVRKDLVDTVVLSLVGYLAIRNILKKDRHLCQLDSYRVDYD